MHVATMTGKIKGDTADSFDVSSLRKTCCTHYKITEDIVIVLNFCGAGVWSQSKFGEANQRGSFVKRLSLEMIWHSILFLRVDYERK